MSKDINHTKNEPSDHLIAGVLVGFIIGLLIAPEKGTETRKTIKKMANRLIDGYETLQPKIAKVTSKTLGVAQNSSEQITGLIDIVEKESKILRTKLHKKSFFKGLRK